MPRPLDPRIKEQLDHAYRRMAKFYRPAAPSDGFGNIEVHPTDPGTTRISRRVI